MGENCNVERIENVVNTSVRPPGEKTKVFQSDGTGMKITLGWKGWMTVLAILVGGGGGATGLSLVTDGQLDEKIAETEKKQTAQIEEVKTEVGENRKSIDALTKVVESVQKVQHGDIAHRDARRVVEEGMSCNSSQRSCRRKRSEKVERIRRINVKRLKDGRATCDQLDCLD